MISNTILQALYGITTSIYKPHNMDITWRSIFLHRMYAILDGFLIWIY
jgi:hypothetical protein